MFLLPAYHDEALDIDGTTLHLKIKRFTLEEHAAFQKRRDENQRAERRVDVLLKRHERPEDQDVEKDKDGQEIRTSNLQATLARLELDAPDAFAALQAERDKFDALALSFWQEILRDYIRVPEGQIPGTTGETNGLCLLPLAVGRMDIEKRIAGLVFACNTMTPRQKKVFLSLLDFAPSSTEPSPTPHGDGPATTAAPADEKASANPEAATVSTADASSGTTAPSS